MRFYFISISKIFQKYDKNVEKNLYKRVYYDINIGKRNKSKSLKKERQGLLVEDKRDDYRKEQIEQNFTSIEQQASGNSKKKILVVDDEKRIVDILIYNLQKEGYSTIEANDGEEAIKIAMEQKPDLILLDIMLPKVDGLTVCKRLRHTLNVPILILSAKDEEIDKILGLELGADDYITKPFSVRELMARVKANLRKAEIANYVEETPEEPKKANNMIKIGDLTIDLDKFEVRVRGEVIDLTLREFEVLKYLANQPGQVVTREILLEKVWGYEYYGDIRTVDVTVRRIREKIEKDTSAPKILITKRGVGYYLATN